MKASEEWVQIESPIGEAGSLDSRKVLEEVGRMVCGGAAIEGDLVLVRHTVPLLNLDINEFERPLALVTSSADELEQKLLGVDTF